MPSDAGRGPGSAGRDGGAFEEERTVDTITRLFEVAAKADRVGLTVTRAGLVVVLVWIGGLKVFRYEADGIVPFVANSPFMSFFYADAGQLQGRTRTPRGRVVPANRAWHEANRTYPFAWGLGSVIVALRADDRGSTRGCPQSPPSGSFLVFVMSFVTLSFLVTTPECWVPDRGGPEHGFPLPERGRAAGGQGRDHDGGGPGHDGRLREGVPAAGVGPAIRRRSGRRSRRLTDRRLRSRPIDRRAGCGRSSFRRHGDGPLP